MTIIHESPSLLEPETIITDNFLCRFDTHSSTRGQVINYIKLAQMVSKPLNKKANEATKDAIKPIKAQLPLITPFVNNKTYGKTKSDALEAQYSCIVIDFDHEQSRTLEEMKFNIEEEYHYNGTYIGFTTSSHSLNGENAFKIVIPLALPCDVHQYTALSEGIMLLLNTDPAQARKTQGFYEPCDLLEPSVYEGGLYGDQSQKLDSKCELWAEAIKAYLNNIESEKNLFKVSSCQNLG